MCGAMVSRNPRLRLRIGPVGPHGAGRIGQIVLRIGGVRFPEPTRDPAEAAAGTGHPGSLGSPSTRSAAMLRCTSDVPA